MVTISNPTGSPQAAILGIGTYRPGRVIPNSEIIAAIDSSDEWIQQRSGIKQRRWALPHETVQMMSVEASRKAVASSGLDMAQIDAIVVATVSHMFQTPAVATAIAHELGTNKASAFDISAACAGFCYGVALASDMVRGGTAKYVVVIGCEKLSDFTDSYDRTSAFIFGDGAGAVVIGPSDTPGIGPTVWGSDGSQYDAITQRASWIDVRDHNVDFPMLTMQGQKVFRWAVWQMAPVAQQALDAAGVTADELDAFIPHQANMRITDAMIKVLKLPEHVPVARDIAEMGNTSAASIPLAMERMIESGEAKSGGTALLIGFGAGLVYAAQVVTLP
jgi:3-oxoacyl-[acyl-carrier-protein] synthase-3